MEIDLIPLAQLPSRYGIARSNLYNRLKDLKIESVKQEHYLSYFLHSSLD